jgi:galactokinase
VEELVSEALAVEGVLGARMMGGGEGGTALILLSRVAVPSLTDLLSRGYYARQGRVDGPEPVHVFGFAPGAHVKALV